MSAGLLVLRELRRAFRDERVALADERAALELTRDDHLAPLAEGVGHHARVGDRHRGGAVAVAHAEAELVAPVADRPLDHLSGELVGAARLELARLARLRGGAEARVDQGRREQDGGREGDDKPELALARGVHSPDASAGWGAPRPAMAPETGAGARPSSRAPRGAPWGRSAPRSRKRRRPPDR